jgi:hypothetical protein
MRMARPIGPSRDRAALHGLREIDMGALFESRKGH